MDSYVGICDNKTDERKPKKQTNYTENLKRIMFLGEWEKKKKKAREPQINRRVKDIRLKTENI